MSKKLNNLEKVFSMTNDNYHKVITIVGIKWKFKSKKLLKKYNIKSNSFLEDIFSIKNEKREALKFKIITILGLKFKFKKAFASIVFPKYKEPLVSIIIPVFNQFDYTMNCLESIKQNIGEIPFEIIIADDCSTDETKNIKNKVSNITVIRNDENLGFIKNCNNAAKLAKGKYLYFLNNDTEVQKDWLKELLYVYDNFQNVGAVGSKLCYSNGELQEYGTYIYKDFLFQYPKQFYNNRCLNYVTECGYASGCSNLTPKEIFDKVGGFDEMFAPAYYDDPDYAFKLKKIGLKSYINPLSLVVHYEKVSYSQKKLDLQERNKQIFINKWRNELENKAIFNKVKLPFSDKLRPKTILIIDDFLPQFDKHAGGKTIFQFLQLFKKSGSELQIKFCPACSESREEPYESILNRMGIEIINVTNLKEYINCYSSIIDYVFISRPDIAMTYLPEVLKYKNIKVLYYGHDLHYLRYKRDYKYSKSDWVLEQYNRYKEVEPKIINLVDVAYYPSKIEVDLLHKEFPNANVKMMTPYMYDLDNAHVHNDFEHSKNIMFVGGFKHSPNVDGILWFVKNVFPSILESNPEIVLNIAGSSPTEEILSLANDNIKVFGFLEQDKLDELYQKSRISIAPLRYGAGIKGKVIESLYNGLPVITTDIGIEGIENSNNAITVANEASAFAKELINLYNNKTLWNEKSIKSREIVKNNYSFAAAEKIFKEDINFEFKENIISEDLFNVQPSMF